VKQTGTITDNVILLLMPTVFGRSIFLRARAEVSATWTEQHGRADQLGNEHLLRLLRHHHHHCNDCRRTHRPKDVLRDSADVAHLCVIWQVAGTHCQGVLSLSDCRILYSFCVCIKMFTQKS